MPQQVRCDIGQALNAAAGMTGPGGQAEGMEVMLAKAAKSYRTLIVKFCCRRFPDAYLVANWACAAVADGVATATAVAARIGHLP